MIINPCLNNDVYIYNAICMFISPKLFDQDHPIIHYTMYMFINTVGHTLIIYFPITTIIHISYLCYGQVYVFFRLSTAESDYTGQLTG